MNTKRRIKKVAVIGSGIMGSGIACHFANIGLEVLLLDIVPKSLNDKEEKQKLAQFVVIQLTKILLKLTELK